MLTANYLTSVPDSELGFSWISVDENSGKEEILSEGKTFTLTEEHIGKRIKLCISYKKRKYESKPLYIYGIDKAIISMAEYGTAFANVKTFRQEKYPYSVKIESATGDTYSISASFGEKVYTENVYVARGDEVVLNFEAEPLKNYKDININNENTE